MLEHRLAQVERRASAPKHKNRHTGTGIKIEKNREERNGVKRPSIGGKCRAVWDALDEFVATSQRVPTAKDVKGIADKRRLNAANATVEFYNWRKFHGITGYTVA